MAASRYGHDGGNTAARSNGAADHLNKEQIREFALGLGADYVGFAAAEDYVSPRSPALGSLMPEVRSLVVLAFRESSSCESQSPQMAMAGRMDVMEFSRSVNYRLTRHLERAGSKAMAVPASYPMEMSAATKGCLGEVSLRHAAVAAGLGTFGRHNIVIHPELGTRVIFSAILSSLDLASDMPLLEDLCLQCGTCVSSCPADALAVAGQTHVGRCLGKSQPYGIGGAVRFWSRFAEADDQQRHAMLKDPEYWKLYQAGFIGFQYFCFNCLNSCPVGQSKE